MHTSTAARSGRPDYGLDAPGVRSGMLAAGGVGLGVMIAAILVSRHLPSGLATQIGIIGLIVAAYGLFMASYMTCASRYGKLRTRETLLDQVGSIRQWTGDEAVLDVGCGRGLMLIGAAKRLKRGQATGIDLWLDRDQAENSADAALENARMERVADRVRIDTGDMRSLPYADGSFDIVLSHWVVHNLPDPADRRRALDEMLRVLRPGGVLVLADIANMKEYRDHLRRPGVADSHLLSGGLEARIMAVLSGGSYCPQALLARRP